MIDQVLRSMQHPRRRRIVYALLEQDTRDGLVVPDDVHDGDRDLEALDIELFHRHLPVLEDSGLVRWDRDRGHVAQGPTLDEVRPLVESIRESDEL